jgi:hypothetical protein
MRALLDTNIIIHREAGKVINQDIGILYRWLERGKYVKCVHAASVQEILKYKDPSTVDSFKTKLESYELIEIPSPLAPQVIDTAKHIDVTENDKVDTLLLNEVYGGRVDILITEDKKIHKKAHLLGISDRVFTIDSFLEKVFAEHPDLVNYKVLNVQKLKFGKINLGDSFFDSLKQDYPGFEQWFLRKFDEDAYITYNSNNGLLLSFLYLKVEDSDENYSDIIPVFQPEKRLKIGTLKVINNGLRLGERFLKIIFDNALANKVDGIYVTIFDRTEEQRRLIDIFELWGFTYWGKKKDENVYVRNFKPMIDFSNLKSTYPYISRKKKKYIVPIYPDYHTDLLPDSILNNESPADYIEDFPHRNSISKVYVSRSLLPHPSTGDLLVFYRTGGYYKGVLTTIGIVNDVRESFSDEEAFISYCRKGSVFPEKGLREMWQYRSSRPFVVSFLYVYSFPHRINMKNMIDLHILNGINDAPRGFYEITDAQFNIIIKETKSEYRFIID